MATRTNKRSRSGAHVPCPDCGKRLRTAKGLAMHQTEVHPSETKDAGAAIEGPGHPYGLEHPVQP
jgi:hypothetical protein